MNRLARNLCIVGLAIGASLPAAAAEYAGQTYAEASYGWLKLSSDGFDVTTGDIIGRLGYEFTKNLGAEVFLASSMSGGKVNGVDVKVDSAYGGYLKGRVEASPGFELFAKLGWVDAKLKASIPGASVSDSNNSFSYGVGAQYTFSEKWYAQVDYMSYYDKGGDSIKGPSLGVGVRF